MPASEDRGRRLRRAVKYGLQEALRRRGLEVTRFRSGVRAFEEQALAVLAPDAVLDVGANVGQFARRLRLLGFEGDIWSFEPSAEAHAELLARARVDPRLHPVHAAVGASPGTATLWLSGNSVSSSLLQMEPRHEQAAPASRVVGSTEVEVLTLDAWSRETGLPGRLWLKADTQGGEGDVLAGAGEVLKRTDLLRLEVSLVPLYRGQPDHLELLAMLRELGFEVAYVEPSFEDRRTRQLLQLDLCLLSTAAAERLAAGAP